MSRNRAEHLIIVAGHGSEDVTKTARTYAPDSQIVTQSAQLGTAHAVAQSREILSGFEGDLIILYGDTPFIRPETLGKLAQARQKSDLVVLGFQANDPGRYGRLVTSGTDLLEIVEYKEANAAQKDIKLCNSGVLAGPAKEPRGMLITSHRCHYCIQLFITVGWYSKF